MSAEMKPSHEKNRLSSSWRFEFLSPLGKEENTSLIFGAADVPAFADALA